MGLGEILITSSSRCLGWALSSLSDPWEEAERQGGWRSSGTDQGSAS